MTQDWELWQHYLRLHSLIITSMVGQWNTLKEDNWFYAPSKECLYKHEQNSWIKFVNTSRSRSGYFKVAGTAPPEERIFLAHVFSFQNLKVCHGWRTEV